ncbi:MAG: glycogen debranching protein [Chloroflexota bacterium]|nr:MAG: glycogen debranching protein [Chloroflexota bacterium]
MPTLVISRAICANLEAALDREWLVTNGLGGYASSTIVGANTRRYHGLLVAALPGSRDRLVLLSKIEEEVDLGDHTYYLSVNEYPNAAGHPGGFVHLEEFRLEHGLPVCRFGVAGMTLEKRVWIAHERNTTYISYHLIGSRPLVLRLGLLTNYRSIHALTTGTSDRGFQVEAVEGGCAIQSFDGATPYRVLAVPGAAFHPVGVWYWHFIYRRERERGMDYTEDLYMPGHFEAHLEPGESLTLVATTEPADQVELDAQESWEREVNRRRGLIALLGEDREDDFAAHLALAADQFLIRSPLRPENGSAVAARGAEIDETVVAGYHWFTDWGRDTAIALPGLTLSCGRPDEARRILRTWAAFVHEGLLPNRFPEDGQSVEYNSVDAPLWLFQTVDRYLSETSDRSLLEEIYPTLRQIVESYARGTLHGIGVDPIDGLLSAGEPGFVLTWMDAKIDDWVVTPRSGKPVEVNALWYNALRLIIRWSIELGCATAPFVELAETISRSFAQRFWFEAGGYLYDVVDGENGDDASLRPNQIIAVSLPHALLTREQALRVLVTVERKLLTPVGLRTLSPDDPRFVPRYQGDRRQRDAAYHMGPVWPWLLGPYADACLRLRCDSTAVGRLLLPFQHHLTEAGVGSISEVFDAVKPHTPRGCIAQAWSVAEVLRIWRKAKHFKCKRPSP